MFCPFIKDKCKEEECVCWVRYTVDPSKKDSKKFYSCCYAEGWNNLSRAYFS